MGVLDDLYGHLGSALDAEARLDTDDDNALQQINTRQAELQDQRASAEGDQRTLQAIDSELRELHEAYRTITERRADANQPDHQDPLPSGGDPGDGDLSGDR